MPTDKTPDSKEELKKRLTRKQYDVTQEGATERPFSGTYNETKSAGTYRCVCCGQPLFLSDTKFDSGSGWPSFYAPIEGSVADRPDSSLGMKRMESTCSRCAAHLGHLFEDGPDPTGLRYCINSAALELDEKE